ncbi:MAG TPA: PTS transporter subunit EIIC [Candidatus Baltobacteraceae bacterium]|nr:PTS transporter subunit EIIC [Candidatus Baltobacteraceae bacterium]
MRWFGDRPFVVALREALPWSFIGLLAALFVFLPLTPAPGPLIGPGLGFRVSGALLPAFAIMGMTLVPLLTWRYARHAKLPVLPLVAGGVIAFVFSFPPVGAHALRTLHDFGESALFLALVIAGVVALAVAGATRAKLPMAPWIGAAAAIVLALALREAHVSAAVLVTALLAPLAHLGDTYIALLAIVVVETLLWSIGMHGPALLAAIVTPVYLTLQMQNSSAYAAHQPLPHIVVVSLFLFVFPGGAGATLPLAALLAISRVAHLRTIGRVTILPALFNMNEPLLFGVPVVFNPFLIPPFIIVPVILATTTYAAVALGLVGRPIFYVPSSIPTLVSTFVATLDWRAVVLAGVNITLAFFIYLPFVRAYERHLEHTP